MALGRPLKRSLTRLIDTLTPKTDWTRLLSKDKHWQRAVASAGGSGRRVLIATSTGGHEAMTPVESLLAVALTLRGVEVHLLLCDAFLPACMMQTAADLMDRSGGLSKKAALDLCRECQKKGNSLFSALGLTVHTYGSWVDAAERARCSAEAASIPKEDLRGYRRDGIGLGEQALAGALRFFATSDLDGEPQAETILRRYLESAILTQLVTRRLLEKYRFDRLVAHHGIYVPQGVIGETARGRSVAVIHWNLAYRKRRVIFSHQDTYHRTMMDEPTASWETLPWSPVLDRELEEYLQSRRTGYRDWITFHEDPKDAPTLPAPYALLLTNVAWDARLHYDSNIFPDMMSWILGTIAYFAAHPEKRLVIRVHPAERSGIPKSRQTVRAAVEARYRRLPKNVVLIGPEDPASTYALADRCDAALIFATKTGVELAAQGIPVITAGEAWIRNKGISLDPHTQAEYYALLDRLPMPDRMDGARKERARRYAYHFFFRRMIPLRALQDRPKGTWPPVRVHAADLEMLLPGRDPGLDLICEGILKGTPFVYPEEAEGHSR